MKITRAEQLYLFTIYDLSKRMKCVKSADLARNLGYSRPSVFGLINKLIEKKLVFKEENKNIILTGEGLLAAKKISNRHRLIRQALIGLGASKDVAERDARNIENNISDELLEKIDNHIEKHLNELKNKTTILE